MLKTTIGSINETLPIQLLDFLNTETYLRYVNPV